MDWCVFHRCSYWYSAWAWAIVDPRTCHLDGTVITIVLSTVTYRHSTVTVTYHTGHTITHGSPYQSHIKKCHAVCKYTKIWLLRPLSLIGSHPNIFQPYTRRPGHYGRWPHVHAWVPSCMSPNLFCVYPPCLIQLETKSDFYASVLVIKSCKIIFHSYK